VRRYIVRFYRSRKWNLQWRGSAVPVSEINCTIDAEAYALTILVILVSIPILVDWMTR
jgi:hypothetical protein